MKLKSEQGITLVALVVTIIVLIILAGISISLVLGENGIISKAQAAKKETINAQEDEKVKLNETVDIIDEYVLGSNRDNKIEYRKYQTKMPSAAGVWTKIVEGEFDPENDYIVAYKIYTDGLWQQVCVQNQIMTFEIKEDGIYSFFTYGGMIGKDAVLIISSFK